MRHPSTLRAVAVGAMAAADQAGLDARRLHLRHLRIDGARLRGHCRSCSTTSSPCRRASTRLLPDGAEELHRYVVLGGEEPQRRPDVNLEFEKDFAHYRFHPDGRWVAERLWTEGSVEP